MPTQASSLTSLHHPSEQSGPATGTAVLRGRTGAEPVSQGLRGPDDRPTLLPPLCARHAPPPPSKPLQLQPEPASENPQRVSPASRAPEPPGDTSLLLRDSQTLAARRWPVSSSRNSWACSETPGCRWAAGHQMKTGSHFPSFTPKYQPGLQHWPSIARSLALNGQQKSPVSQATAR